MHVVVAAVGRAQGSLADGIRDYEERAGRYWPLRVHEVKAEPARALPPSTVKAREGERLAAVLPSSALVVVCDERGSVWTSDAFARWMHEQRERARDVAFVVGGAFGLDATIVARAGIRLALAPWTLPHDLARLVLAEQLYRAGTIVRGEPYHKA